MSSTLTLPLFDEEPAAPELKTPVAVRVPASEPIHPLIREVLGDGIGEVLGRTFRQIELAESCLSQMSERYPQSRETLRRAFLALRWRLSTPPVERVYLAHVQELLERARQGRSLAPGTKAEVLMGLSEASLHAPFASRAAALFEQLFREMYAEEADLDGEPFCREPWVGASEELLGEARRKLADESRQLSPRGG